MCSSDLLRLGPAQEFTANMAMDRFVHALVEASREAGYHVLLFSGGSLNSSIDAWHTITAFDATVEFAQDFRLIALDIRNAGGNWLDERVVVADGVLAPDLAPPA